MNNNEAWLEVYRRRGHIVVSSHKPERPRSIIDHPVTTSGNDMTMRLRVGRKTNLEDAVEQAKLFRELTTRKPISEEIIQLFNRDRPHHYQTSIYEGKS